LIVDDIYVMLSCRRQHQLLANIFAAAEKLQNCEKRNAPVLENKKAGVLILNTAHLSYFRWAVCLKGGDAMRS